MKILILSNHGMGLYKFRKELLEKLINDNHEVIIDLPYDDYVPLMESMGVQYLKSDIERRGINPFKDLKTFFSYLSKIRKIKPDIVLTYTVKPNIYGGLVCSLTKTPYLTNITGLGTSFEKDNMIQKLILNLYKISLKKSDCIFFQNKLNEQFFVEKRILKTKSKLLPGSGVNLEENRLEDYPSQSQNLNFLFIGRIMKSKGIEEYLEAATVIKEKYSNIEFEVIGFCEEDYSSELNNLNNANIINYIGEQKDIHSFIKKAHAIILPSYHEGMSNVLLESASTGRPILASNIAGCKEIFDEGSSGFGFEPRNTNSLINAIEKFIALSPEEKRQMGMNGRKKVEVTYDRKIVVNAYIDELTNINKRGSLNESISTN